MQFDQSQMIYRFGQGIKLVTIKPGMESRNGHNTFHTVSDVLTLPFNFYFLNTEGNTLLMNEESAFMCGFPSAEESIGKSLFDVSDEDSATKLINNCTDVINTNSVKIFEEQNIRKDGLSLQFLSIKCPWYNQSDEIIGVFGCSIVLGTHGLAASLSAVMALGLFDTDKIPVSTQPLPQILKSTQTYLSKREMECLHLTIKGYTAKKIARELNISHRTVEEYLLNIRIKTGASSKSELIEMTIDEFLPIEF